MKINKKLLTFSLTAIIILLLFFLYIFFSCIPTSTCKIPYKKDYLRVHYIDVGQGDSILIQFNDKNLLIDAGCNNKKVQRYLKKCGVKRLNYLIATHPHDDHIGGMHYIIDKFKIDKFLAPKATNNTATFKNMLIKLKENNLKITTTKAGDVINLDPKLNIFVVAPSNYNYKNLNNYSIVIKLSYNKTSFLFCGDAENLSEDEILKEGYNIESDILKLGHHGSNTSSSKNFLDDVNPKIAIISCGKNNDYGHPHKETLKKLKTRNITTYRTDIHGTIILESNGIKIIKRQ
ncbi:MBL fold metallo-hydrolase [Clostridium botulinum]|uniref:ComEC/Rec2 family competence protein n=1 Tax=Clostridium botulinum TaxID=1491 RepID=UPI000993064B|nr:ComEC/Rec2 family competence protein [Clostridium botulinum]NFO99218.1 MBL fold metallo-hydrolase [Clostridium botulinum]OOV50597.1 MBL fold metallo-hydrolase [Clostridium botulinum D/C]OOV53664.1 MBL fold metallo-hydrolase [Clostridium botulinum D/C]OOV54452.1 MBL fold metallo-hydrolase [Clostridium botulinum D/C]OOV54684.1 MBL fold metallo-hydrolase [Clostridium botulinum D/C]